MRIEIDSSGLWGRTSEPSVFAFSNSKSRAILISSQVKATCLQEARNRYGKTTINEYLRLYSICIFLLIRDDLSKVSEIVLDLEYKGKMGMIRSFLLELIEKKNPAFTHISIRVRQVGKRSPAHAKSNAVYRGDEEPDRKIRAEEIIKLL